MELTIKITDKKAYDSLMKFLRTIGIKIVAKKKDKKKEIDAITLISQKSLAEDWDSKEDEKWDEIL